MGARFGGPSSLWGVARCGGGYPGCRGGSINEGKSHMPALAFPLAALGLGWIGIVIVVLLVIFVLTRL